jgi:hypothetical protein
MGSGLVKIPVGSALFYIIKFGIILGVLGIGLWTWYKAKKNNPAYRQAGNPPTEYLKLALFVPFTIDFHLHYAFIFLTIILFNKKLLLPWNSPLKPIYLLFIWGFISYVVNQFIEFNPLSFPLFVITFFLPFIYLTLFYNNVSNDNMTQLFDFINSIVLIMTIIILMQTVILWGAHPDTRTGGTISAHYAAIFVSIAFMFALFNNEKLGTKFRLYKKRILLTIAFPLLFLIDAKYILLFLLLSVGLSFFIFRINKTYIKVGILGAIIIIILSWYNFTNGIIPLSGLVLNDVNFTVEKIYKKFSESPKAELLANAVTLPKTDPLVFLIGSGPGTFLSRAASSITVLEKKRVLMTPTGNKILVDSKLPGFLPFKTSWIKLKYGMSYFADNDIISALYNNKSSMINIYYEFGILGLCLFIGFFIYLNIKYFRARLNDDKSSVFCFTLFIFLLSLIEFWFEQPTFQILSYSVLGMKLLFVKNKF